MPLIVKSKRASLEKLKQQFPTAVIVDVTSRGPEPWVRFSPFYPHGDIPVPLSPGHVATSVEGIWQGLKVFETADVDLAKFTTTTMKGIKRTVGKYGKVLGHRAGVHGDRLLSYAEARRSIYLPAYRWVLEHRLQDLIDDLTRLSAAQTVLLLDYETNADLDDLSRPLSHASLIQQYSEGRWPQ
jgi:hypothetical protein